MFSLPTIPELDGLHPLVVHFPIALLLVAPFLILIGLFYRNKTTNFLMAGFLVLLLGTISSFVAILTGESAGELVDKTPQITELLKRHKELAELTRNFFIIMTIVYGVILLLPRILKNKLKSWIFISVHIAFIILYSYGCLLVANTADMGGKLVHGLGVKAMIKFDQKSNKPVQWEAVPEDSTLLKETNKKESEQDEKKK